MYNVVLVDDESSALEGLVSFVNWEKYGFKIAARCKSGNEAFRVCSKLEPELLITDIRMNDGDGLELINNIRSSDVQTEVIIITGFEDFHVAQTAIEQNVHQILLKPLERETLIKSLESVCKKIDTQKMNAKIMKTYTNYNNSQFLHTLLNTPDLNDERFFEICEKYKVTLPHRNYLVALVHIDLGKDAGYDNQHFALIDILNNITLTSRHFIMVNALSSKNVPLLIFENRDSGFEGILKLLNSVRREFKSLTGISLTIGISLLFNKITSISHALRQAVKAIESISYFGNDCIIDYSHISLKNSGQILPFTQKEIYSLCSMIKKFDKQSATTFIDSYFEKFSDRSSVDIEEVRNNILELAIYVIKECVQNSVALTGVLGRNLVPSSELQQLETITNIHRWIDTLICTLCDNPEIIMSQKFSPMVQNAIIYTMTNYSEPLTAAFVAHQLYVSCNHFMRIFKKETGKTYGQYLTDHRIKTAITLLKSKEYKIYEVGQMVGYSNTKYFSRIFKKNTGHSPSFYCGEEE